jgi:hypothetical protein
MVMMMMMGVSFALDSEDGADDSGRGEKEAKMKSCLISRPEKLHGLQHRDAHLISHARNAGSPQKQSRAKQRPDEVGRACQSPEIVILLGIVLVLPDPNAKPVSKPCSFKLRLPQSPSPHD